MRCQGLDLLGHIFRCPLGGLRPFNMPAQWQGRLTANVQMRLLNAAGSLVCLSHSVTTFSCAAAAASGGPPGPLRCRTRIGLRGLWPTPARPPSAGWGRLGHLGRGGRWGSRRRCRLNLRLQDLVDRKKLGRWLLCRLQLAASMNCGPLHSRPPLGVNGPRVGTPLRDEQRASLGVQVQGRIKERGLRLVVLPVGAGARLEQELNTRAATTGRCIEER
mmetsp:Transcript_52983/g.113659  ORF Transcript_52983/g.113659 Transcript_52983/m.113659 type:complete len:218 (-) Transcript_52983:604-1257(-)